MTATYNGKTVKDMSREELIEAVVELGRELTEVYENEPLGMEEINQAIKESTRIRWWMPWK